MIRKLLRRVVQSCLFISALGFGQDIPIVAPHLLPFPGISVGLSYFSLVPSQNIEVNPIPGGWTIQDTLRGVMTTLDFELVRYRWWDHLKTKDNFDAYSSLHYTIASQLGSIALPSGNPTTFELNGSDVGGFQMNMLVKSFSLGNTFVYDYSKKSSLNARIGLGFSHFSLYKNAETARILEANGFKFDLGVGWKYSLLGRMGKRFRLGVELGLSVQSFDLNEQPESLILNSGSTSFISPVQTLSLNTPEIKLNLEVGEALFGAYSPYRDPYRLGLFNLKAGYGIFNYEEGVTLHHDAVDTTLSAPFLGTLSQSYDLQLIKYNWLYHFLPQSSIDLFSGLGVRLLKTFQSTPLPGGWARSLTDGSETYLAMRFAPRVYDFYLDHEIVYPLGPKLYSRVTAGTGFATMTLYENVGEQRLVDANTFTWHTGAGLGYSIRGDGSSRVSFGLGVDYYHQAFDLDMSNSKLSATIPGEHIPIQFLDLSQAVFSLNIGLMFGGLPNAAMKAHEAFKNKRFSTAMEIQHELLQFNPKHHNKKAVLLEREMVEDSLVTRYYRDIRVILSQGKLHDALALIEQGEAPPEEAIEQAVAKMKVEISDRSLEAVAQALKILDYELAEDLILLALKSDPSCYPVAKILLARSYIIRATVLYQSGVYGRSLYWLRQADGLTDRYLLVTADLRQKIGDGRLEDANEGILKEDRQMVYESMKDAKSLNPRLRYEVDEHLKDLEDAIAYADAQTLAPMKRMAMDNLLEDIENLDPDNFIPKIGMKGSLIINYVGPPERKFKEGEYELYVYPKSESTEIWLYLKEGSIEKIEYQDK